MTYRDPIFKVLQTNSLCVWWVFLFFSLWFCCWVLLFCCCSNFYFVSLILFFFPGKFIWLLYVHSIVLKVPMILGLFIKLYSVWTWWFFFRIIPWAIMWLQYAILFASLCLVIQNQSEGSLKRLDMYYSYETAFITSAPYILEQRIQFWLKSLKVWHFCFIYCMN